MASAPVHTTLFLSDSQQVTWPQIVKNFKHPQMEGKYLAIFGDAAVVTL